MHHVLLVLLVICALLLVCSMLYKLVWFVHYTQVAPLARRHCASCIVGDLCIFAGVQYAWCGLCIIVSCALQAPGSTCSVVLHLLYCLLLVVGNCCLYSNLCIINVCALLLVVHYRELAPLARCHCASCIVGNVCR